MIRLRNVEKFYETGAGRTYVLRRIDLDVREGEFISIMGPSGSGKTTLLSILGFLDSAWAGEYYFMEQPVHKLNHKERAALHKRHIGFVFQSYHLIDSLTVKENLEVPLSYRDVKRSEIESIVADVLDRFQIVGKKDLFPNQLSGGQQQLVAVARAVVASPRLILAHGEPREHRVIRPGRRRPLPDRRKETPLPDPPPGGATASRPRPPPPRRHPPPHPRRRADGQPPLGPRARDHGTLQAPQRR